MTAKDIQNESFGLTIGDKVTCKLISSYKGVDGFEKGIHTYEGFVSRFYSNFINIQSRAGFIVSLTKNEVYSGLHIVVKGWIKSGDVKK